MSRRWRNSILIAFFTALLFCGMWNVPALQVVEDPLYNLAPRCLTEAAPSREIVVILLKDTDVSAGPGGLSGSYFQKLLDTLNVEMKPSRKGDPRLLLLDYFYFFGAPGWKGASAFTRAVKRFRGTVVYSGLATSQNTTGASQEQQDFIMPAPFFSRKHPVGIANIPLSSDGKVYYVHWDYHGKIDADDAQEAGLPAFSDMEWDASHSREYPVDHWAELGVAAFMLHEGLYGRSDPDQVVPESQGHTNAVTHQITLRFPRLSGKGFLGGFFQCYTVSEILNNKLDSDDIGVKDEPQKALRNADMVFVGDDRTVRQQLRGTPAGAVPAIFIPAVVAWDLMNGKFVFPVPAFVQSLVILFFCLLPVPFLNISVIPRGPFAFLAGRDRTTGRRPFIAFGIVLLALLLFVFLVIRRDFAYDLALVFPAAGAIVSFAGISFYLSDSAEREVSKTVQLLSRYLSPDLARAYQENPENLDLDGRLDVVTILFCDVRGFTTASEKMPPEEIVKSLKAYYDAAGSVIIGKRGFLAKFIGDAIMGVFSEPHPQPDDAVRAVEASLEILKSLETLNRKWEKEGKEAWKIGIGINTGKAVWGAMGFKDKEELTIIGDAVNVASRLQDLTKEYQVPIILSESTYQAIGEARDRFVFKTLGESAVRGRTQPVPLWTVSRAAGEDP